jgi:hypothetical protein
MTDEEDFESVAPEHWISVMNRLLCRLWGIIRDEDVTDEDRRDARGGVRDGDDE